MAADFRERRRSMRYPSHWLSYLPKTGNRGGPFRVVDASDTGLFIAMETLPAKDTNLIIEVIIRGKAIMVSGKVVRHMVAPEGAPMPNGVGLQLTRKPDNWQDLVKTLGEDDDQPRLSKADIQVSSD